jgi:hypothetical protein
MFNDRSSFCEQVWQFEQHVEENWKNGAELYLSIVVGLVQSIQMKAVINFIIRAFYFLARWTSGHLQRAP